MAYLITFAPLNRIPGTQPKTVSKETAAEAWILVQQLQASDEKAEVRTEAGHEIGWQELRALAEQEKN